MVSFVIHYEDAPPGRRGSFTEGFGQAKVEPKDVGLFSALLLSRQIHANASVMWISGSEG